MNAVAGLVWAGVAAAVIGMGALGIQAAGAPERDASGCLAAGSPNHNVLLIDASDRLEDEQIETLQGLIRKILRETGPDDRFSIYKIGNGSSSVLEKVSSVCGVTGGRIYRERAQSDLLWNADRRIHQLGGSEAPLSPIIETVESLLNKREVFDATNVKLWVVSDFIENGRQISFYPRSSRYWKPRADHLPESILPPQGRLHAVQLMYLPRVRLLELQKRTVPFWLAYIGRLSETKPEWEFLF